MMLARYVNHKSRYLKLIGLSLTLVIAIVGTSSVGFLFNSIASETVEQVELLETKTEYLSKRQSIDSALNKSVEKPFSHNLAFLSKHSIGALKCVTPLIITELYIKFSQLLH